MLHLALMIATTTLSYGADAKQRVDVIAPPARADGTLSPVAIFLHGGVWQHGDRAHARAFGDDLARHGFVTFVASYRLAPAHRWPAQRDDAHAVLALAAREAAAHGGDATRILLIGHSAGAQLAALVALDARTRAQVRALALFSGVFELEQPLDEAQPDGGFASFIAPVFTRAQLADASPLRSSARFDVPVLLVTSERDYRAMHAQTLAMHAHLLKRQEGVELLELPGVDHFGMVARLDDATGRLLRALVER